MYSRILVPLDGSPLAETAITHAELLASATGAELELIRVAVLRFVQQPGKEGYVVQNGGDREEAEAYLQEWQRRLSDNGIRATYQVRVGNVAEEIVQYAAATRADIIVMSTHGRTGARLWAYGSIAEKVLRVAPCSVLVVRTRTV
ncbi:MAG: universal stress protein [Sphingomonadaceae bacterium]